MAGDEIAAFVESWRTALGARDADGLRALWDQTYERLSYLPTEGPAFLTTWDEISAYYDRMCSGTPIKELVISDLTVDVLSDSHAFAFCYIAMASQAGTAVRRWNGRIQFHLRRVDGRWRLIHYEDSTDLKEAGGFMCRLQEPGRAKVADAIRSGDSAAALRLLGELATPPAFASAEWVEAQKARDAG